jgi:hypothetical protein
MIALRRLWRSMFPLAFPFDILQKQKRPASLSGRGPEARCEALVGRLKYVDRPESERRGRSDGGKNSSRHIGLLLASAHILIV